MKNLLRLGATALFLPLFILTTLHGVAVKIDTWKVTWEKTMPRDPAVGPDGQIWFVGQTGDYVASLQPKSGEFKRYDLTPGTGPHTVIVGKDGIVWYAGNRAAHIGRLDPESGEIKKFPLPHELRDPHTMVFSEDGNHIWFTSQIANHIGYLNIETGQAKALPIPTPNARPYGLVAGDAGQPWAVLFGTHKLARIDPDAMTLTEIDLPEKEARPRRLVVLKNGQVWYVDYATGALGCYDPETDKFSRWPTPSGSQSRPYAMAADDQGRLWFVETGPQPNQLVGFDPASEKFFSITKITDSGGATRHMVFNDNALWFGLDTGFIARATLPEIFSK